MLSLPNLLTLSRILAVPILVFLLWRPAPLDYAITFVLYCVGIGFCGLVIIFSLVAFFLPHAYSSSATRFGSGLVLADSHRQATVSGADECITYKALYRAHGSLDIGFTFLQQAEKVLGSRA